MLFYHSITVEAKIEASDTTLERRKYQSFAILSVFLPHFSHHAGPSASTVKIKYSTPPPSPLGDQSQGHGSNPVDTQSFFPFSVLFPSSLSPPHCSYPRIRPPQVIYIVKSDLTPPPPYSVDICMLSDSPNV